MTKNANGTVQQKEGNESIKQYLDGGFFQQIAGLLKLHLQLRNARMTTIDLLYKKRR